MLARITHTTTMAKAVELVKRAKQPVRGGSLSDSKNSTDFKKRLAQRSPQGTYLTIAPRPCGSANSRATCIRGLLLEINFSLAESRRRFLETPRLGSRPSNKGPLSMKLSIPLRKAIESSSFTSTVGGTCKYTPSGTKLSPFDSLWYTWLSSSNPASLGSWPGDRSFELVKDWLVWRSIFFTNSSVHTKMIRLQASIKLALDPLLSFQNHIFMKFIAIINYLSTYLFAFLRTTPKNTFL